MSNKFKRIYKLILDANVDGEQVIIQPPFTISFFIHRGCAASLNEMNLQIYNLNENTRNKIFQDFFDVHKQKKISLQAGYGEQLYTIFKGDIKMADSYRMGTDIVTNIEALDGGFAQQSNKTSTTKAENTTYKDLVLDLAKSMQGLDGIGKIGKRIKGAAARPISLEGSTYDLLKQYSENKAFIDLEKIYILADNECIKGDIEKINSEMGLLSTPRRADTMLQAEILFEPKIILAQIITIESTIQSQYNGQYKVMGITHSGTISEATGGNCVTKANLLISNPQIGGFVVIS